MLNRQMNYTGAYSVISENEPLLGLAEPHFPSPNLKNKVTENILLLFMKYFHIFSNYKIK